jgi:CheY-like chemotaxis protein
MKLRQAGYPYLIIGVTGNVLDDDVKEYLQAGADLVIGKPLRMDLLEKLLIHIQLYGYSSKYKQGYKLKVNADMLQWSKSNI